MQDYGPLILHARPRIDAFPPLNYTPQRSPLFNFGMTARLNQHVKKTKVYFLLGAAMIREDGEPRPGAEGAAPDNPRERLKGSVQGYHEPLEPVGIDDWDALDLEDDMTTPGGGA